MVLVPYSLLKNPGAILLPLSLWTWLGLMYVVVLGTIVAYVLWYKGIKQTSPVKTVVFHYIVPVVSMALGPFFLGEKINRGQLLGALLVFLGLVAVKWNVRLHSPLSSNFTGSDSAENHLGGGE